VLLADKEEDPYRQYLKAITCYDLAPYAGTVIMLDSRITVSGSHFIFINTIFSHLFSVHKAFLALTDAAHPSALVWDTERNRVVHLVTQTDFLSVLLGAGPDVHVKTLDQCFQNEGISGRGIITAPATMRLVRLFVFVTHS
jgi:hypothetical protein